MCKCVNNTELAVLVLISFSATQTFIYLFILYFGIFGIKKKKNVGMSNYTLRLKRLSGFQHLQDELMLLPQFWILSVPYMFNLRCVHQAGGAVSF